MMIQKKHLAIAASVAATIGLGTSTAQAVDFSATATVENTLTVVNVADMDLGTVFATTNGAAAVNGVGALVMAPDGTVTDPTDSATVQLINLGTPAAAQGSVSMAADFTLTFPDTSTYLAADFAAGGVALLAARAVTTELVHSSANPTVPSLYLTHFTVGDVSGGVATEGTTNVGDFTVVQGFAETTYVFNIGATVTTAPFDAAQQTYQAGVYTGTFAVTASY